MGAVSAQDAQGTMPSNVHQQMEQHSEPINKNNERIINSLCEKAVHSLFVGEPEPLTSAHDQNVFKRSCIDTVESQESDTYTIEDLVGEWKKEQQVHRQ